MQKILQNPQLIGAKAPKGQTPSRAWAALPPIMPLATRAGPQAAMQMGAWQRDEPEAEAFCFCPARPGGPLSAIAVWRDEQIAMWSSKLGMQKSAGCAHRLSCYASKVEFCRTLRA